MSAVTLAPRIALRGDARPEPSEIEELHHAAHDACHLANSVLTEITIAVPPAPTAVSPAPTAVSPART